jgi:cytochrome c553
MRHALLLLPTLLQPLLRPLLRPLLQPCLSFVLPLIFIVGSGLAQAVPDTLAQRALACTACHLPHDRDAPGGYVPRIAGKPAGYVLEQMRNFRDGRRQHSGMARLMEHLDDRYLAELAGFFAAQKPSYSAPGAARLDEATAQRAQRWVQRGDAALGLPACTACHGANLLGVAPSVPGLLGLPAAYLTAQLGAWRQGLRQARAPDCMAKIVKALPAQDLAAIATWLAAQPVPSLAPAVAASAVTGNRAPAMWPLHCGSIAP